MYSYISPEQRVPQEHPLRTIREIVDAVRKELSPEVERLDAASGRPAIAREKLLRAVLLQVLYTVRSERLLMEQLDYNLLFRWFVGLNMDEAVWVPTVFSKNRERLLEGDMAGVFFEGVVAKLREKNLLSDEHFTVDGTLLEAWAGAKSFKRKDGKSGLSRGEAVERNASVRDGFRRAAGEEGEGQGSQAEVRGAPADGKPQPSDCENTVDESDGNGGERRGAGDGGRSEQRAAGERGRAQRVRP